MLENIRQFAQQRYVRWAFIIFLVVPFGLFGIDAYINRVSGPDAVAQVGPASISNTELDQAMRNQAEVYRQQFGRNFDASLMESPEVKRSVLDRLVSEKLIALGAERAGVRVPNRALAERIASEPAFQVDGKFSKERYEQIAKANGLTTLGLDERLRQDFRQQQFRDSIAQTAFVPKATLDSFIRLSEQTREVSVVNLTPEAYQDKVKITPEQVKAYYDGHQAEFTIPERARVEFVEFSADALAARAPVNAEDVKRLYEDGMGQNRWGQPEERRASHILVAAKPDAPAADQAAAEARARALAEQVRKKPDSFADVAKKESQDPGSAVQGGDLGFFPRGAMVKAFEEAAYGAKKGEIVGPVKSDFGYHIIRVTDVKEAKVRPLAEAAPELEAQLKKDTGSRLYLESAEQFSNMVYEQASSLKPVADTLKLQVQQSQWLTKGQPAVPPHLSNPKLQAEIFSDDAVKAKRNTSAVEVAPGVLVAARIVEHKPAELRPLEQVATDIERRLKREEGVKLARADGEAKLKLLQEGKDAGLKWPAPLSVNRQKPGGLFPQVIDRAFRADAKKLPAHLGVESPVGYSLVRVTKVTEPEKIEDSQRLALAAQLRNAVAMEELESTLGSIRKQVGVRVNSTFLEPKDVGQGPATKSAPAPKPAPVPVPGSGR